MKKTFSKITSIGHYLPDLVINNQSLQERFHLDEVSIFKRTGIRERRYASADKATSDLVCEAIKQLLKNTDKKIEDIECIIVGTLTPDYFFPSTAVTAINKLGATKAWGFDLSAACSGFCYGLDIASSLIEVGKIRNAIVCGAEKMSATLNNFDYKTGILFGDGAGAVLLEATEDESMVIKGSLCKVEADDMNDVYFKTPFNSKDWNNEKFELAGHKVYKNGVSLTIDTISEYLEAKSLSLSDFDYIVPHQANMRMLSEIAKGLSIELSSFLINIEKTGNTGGASIPICLAEFYNLGKIKKGDRLLLCSFGSGYTISVIDLIWSI